VYELSQQSASKQTRSLSSSAVEVYVEMQVNSGSWVLWDSQRKVAKAVENVVFF
jgi:hypothetical protein